MEKAKAAVSDFIAKSGQHDTEVHERVDPGVEHKTINPYQREERQIATDREVHQDHYHTTVQPVHDRQVLPEQHHHNLVPVEHCTHDKRDTQETDTHLRQAEAQFKDEQVRTSTQHTSATMPTVAGEHVHHHIHETIRPVVHKETIEPHVMHTTVPIHEVHHNKAQHHAASTLPAVSMDEFKKGGGAMTGREERIDHFQGEPKNTERSLAGGASGLRDSGFSSGSTTDRSGFSQGGLGSGSTTGRDNFLGTTGVPGTRGGMEHGTSHHGTGAATGAGLAAGAVAGDKLSHGRDHTSSGMTGRDQTSSGLTANQGLGNTASAGVTSKSLSESTGQTNTGMPGTRGVVSGMTGSPSDRTETTGSGMIGNRGTSGDVSHRADHTSSSLLGNHGTASSTTGTTTSGGLADKNLRSGGSGMTGSHGTTGTPATRATQRGGMTGSDNMPGELGEFSHPHDGKHQDSVHQTGGLGSSAAGVGSTTTGATGRGPSLMDRSNLKKDADGDGKAGFLS